MNDFSNSALNNREEQRNDNQNIDNEMISVEKYQILSSHLIKFWEIPPETIPSAIQQIFTSLKEFDAILSSGVLLPPMIFVKLHNYALALITRPEIPENLIEPCLDIITDIASDIDENIPEKTFTEVIFPALFRFVDNSNHALDAIAALVSGSLIATNSFFSIPGAYSKIESFLQSDDEDQIISALSIFQGIVSHKEVISESVPLISSVCSFIMETTNSELQTDAFYILITAADTDSGLSTIISNNNFHDIFVSAQNRTSFLTSLRLLRRIATQMTGENPFAFFEKCNLLNFVLQGLNLETTRFISAGIIYTLSLDCPPAVGFFASNNIINLILQWNGYDQKLWFLGLRIISLFCLASPEICLSLINEDGTSPFLDLVLEWLDAIDNPEFQLDLVKVFARYITLEHPKVKLYLSKNQEGIISVMENFMCDSEDDIYKIANMIITAVSTLS